MKEATGEVSMTVVTLIAIAVIGAILAIMWPNIQNRITGLWNSNCGGACTKTDGTVGHYKSTDDGGCACQ